MGVFRGECNFVEFFKVEAVKGLNRGGMDVIKCNSPINIVSCCSSYKQQSGMANDNSITNNIINFPLFPVLLILQTAMVERSYGHIQVTFLYDLRAG